VIVRIAALVRTGVLGGVVVAAVCFPLAALAGLGVKTGADAIDSPLAELPLDAPPAQVSRVYASDGTTLVTQFFEEYRSAVPLTDVAPVVRQAIVASEDGRFYDHRGVDVKGIARAFVANQQAGEVSQGASTLTMQYVRNVLRDAARTPTEVHAATERTPARKLREIRLAMELEKRLTKDEILERYLNVAYFGHRAYGIHAAAEVYFARRPADLTLAEAATLAGLVQAPTAYDPAVNADAARQRRNYVIGRMTELGYLTAEAAAQAQRSPIELRLVEPGNDCVGVPADRNHYGFFCDLFKSWWLAQPTFGTNPMERLDRLRRGGYRVVTSLDPGIQWAAQRNVLAKESPASPFAHGLVAVEPGTGRVRAMAVNRIYSLDQSRNGPSTRRTAGPGGPTVGNYPATVNPLLGGGDLPGYQAGSTFKMFTMLAALEQGLPLATTYHSPQRYRSIYPTEPTNPTRCGLYWCPRNASGAMTGNQSMWSGFGKSVNTYFVQLEQRVGADAAVRMAERLGLTWRTDIDRLQASPEKARGWGAFTLGVADTTPLEMANAYATVAGDGVYCAPLPVLSITTLGGTSAQVPSRCEQVLAPEVAQAAADAARCVTGYRAAAGDCGGWSTAPQVHGVVQRPVAGKTGTTDDTRAAWFVGMTPQLTAASFVADPDNPFHVVGDRNSWKPIMSVAETLRDGLAGTTVRDFAPPPPWIVGTPPKAPVRRVRR
jgi:membrane peptidoglycan carboxypeptidase